MDLFYDRGPLVPHPWLSDIGWNWRTQRVRRRVLPPGREPGATKSGRVHICFFPVRTRYNGSMTRRAFGFFCTLTLVLAILAGVIWVISYRSPIKWAFDSDGIQRSVGSSRGIVVLATDYSTGKVKSLAYQGGKGDLSSWRDFDNRWRSLLRSGINSDVARHGFLFENFNNAGGKHAWSLWSIPHWMLVVVLLLPSVLRLMMPRKKVEAPPEPVRKAREPSTL